MSGAGRQAANHAGLFDQATGEWIGVVNMRGREQIVLTTAERSALTAPGNLSGVTYDGAGRAIAWTIDDVAYTVAYTATSITITGSDGYLREVSLDPLGRVDASTLLEV